MALLRDVIEAEEIRLDRWTVVFRPQSDDSEGRKLNCIGTKVVYLSNHYTFHSKNDASLGFLLQFLCIVF